MKKALILLCVLLPSLVFCVGVSAQETQEVQKTDSVGVRRALLVGVTDYADEKFHNLNYTDNDVRKLQERLSEKGMGFEKDDICLLVSGEAAAFHPTKRNIEKNLAEIMAKSQANDMIFIAFSGHGIQSGPSTFFCAQDTERDALPRTGVDVNGMLGKLENKNICKANFKWVVIDACRDSTRKGSTDGIHPNPPDGVALFQSCSEDQSSYPDTESQLGCFTKQLLDALDAQNGQADKNGDGKLTFQEVCEYTTEQTTLVSGKKQKPTVNMRGEFKEFVLRRDLKRAEAERSLAMAQKYRLEEKYALAKEEIDKALTLYPRDEKYKLEQQTIQKFLDFEDKVKEVEKRQKAETHYTVAKKYHEEKQYQQAMTQIQEALALCPGDEKYLEERKTLQKFLFRHDLLFPEEGVVLFQSCSNGEQSEDDEASNYSLFTKQLLDALDGKADTNQDGNLTLREILEYTSKETSKASNRRQNPTTEGHNISKAGTNNTRDDGNEHVPKRVCRALLVGVTEFSDPKLPNLRSPGNDVKGLREKLLHNGFEDANIYMLDSSSTDPAFRPTKRNIEKCLDKIMEESQPNDIIFIAFSGIGFQNSPNVFFCAEDTKTESLLRTGIEIRLDVLESLKKCKAKFKWLVIDACRSDPIR